MAKRADRHEQAGLALVRLAGALPHADGTPGMLVRTVAEQVAMGQVVDVEVLLDALTLVEASRAGVDQQELALIESARKAGAGDQAVGYALGQDVDNAAREVKRRTSWLRQMTATPGPRRQTLRPA